MFNQPGQSELSELLCERARRIFADRESIARHLHRDRAESFTRASGFEVRYERAEESVPVEATVLGEAPVLGRYEGLLNEHRHVSKRNVVAANDFQASNQAIVTVEDFAALIGLEALDITRRRTAVEPTRAQPDIREING